MWHTDCGDRTLEGAEARFFTESLWDFVCELEVDEGDYDVGLEVFDRLTYGQKISLLSIIDNGLLKPDVPMRKLTAVVEGAIAAVFEQAEPGTEYVITRYRKHNCNLRTQFERIIAKAGLKSWPKLFQNLRSTRETELTERWPKHVVYA